jgi:hypothetical protein
LSVRLDVNGFCLRGREVHWDTIRAIATHKRDLYIYDDICLAFQTETELWVEVSEEEPGFQLLVDEVERRFPSVPKDWFTAVMLPAFEPNYRVLWRMTT